MEVTVTGATGRVGGNVVKGLRDKGYDVRAMVMPGDKAVSKVVQLGAKVVEGSLTNYQDCIKAVEGVDAVVHLGAYMPNILNVEDRRGPEERVRTLFEVNVGGTFNMLEAVARYAKGCIRFVLASTGATYPEGGHKYTPIDEYHPRNPAGMYSYSKVAAEELCWAYQREYSIPPVILRFAYVIGAGELLNKLYFPFIWSKWMLNSLKGAREKTPAVLGAIRQLEEAARGEDILCAGQDDEGKAMRMSIVDVRDLVQGVILALEKETAVGEAFNLAAPAPLLLSEIVPYISKKTGTPYVTVTLPWKQMSCELSIAKARALIGYDPRYDVFRMVDSAILFQKGQDPTVVDRLQPTV